MVIGGSRISIDRVAADRPFYSGKHRRHGMNLQVIASPHGDIPWVSGAPTGSVHDKKAEWIWGVLAELEAVGLVTLVGKGYQGSTHAKIPHKGKNKPESQRGQPRPRPAVVTRRANAPLKTRRILRKLRCRPWRAGQIAKAHPRIAGPRGKRRMKKAQSDTSPIITPLTTCGSVPAALQLGGPCRAARCT